MPLFEFRCRECDHLEEVLQKYTDPAPAVCPACGKEHTMGKEVSLTSFQLKGGGWYKDLYSSAPKDGKKSGDGDGGGKTEGSKSEAGRAEKAEKKVDAKPDTKKADKPAAKSSSSSPPAKAA